MSISINLYYRGENGAARKFVREMENGGIADEIRAEEGNLMYRYFFPADDEECVLLIDVWRDQESLDAHHASPMMEKISALREKYDLHMTAERYISENMSGGDSRFLRK